MKRFFVVAAIAASFVLIQSASAMNLWDVYQQAKNSDPAYQAALATEMSQSEAVPASIAPMLPNINYTATAGLRKTTMENSPQSFTSPYGTQKQRSIGSTLSLTQSVFNFSNWENLAAAKASVKAATATYNAASQDLMKRVVTAYFTVLNAQDMLTYTAAEKRAFNRMYQQTNQGFKVGLNTITDVYNAKAAYDGSVAAYVSAQNAVDNAKEALRTITNELYPTLTPLKQVIPLTIPNPQNIDEWVNKAMQQNWQLVAARYASTAAHKGVLAAEGGHLPTVDFSAEYDNNLTRTFDQGAVRTKGPSAGLQLNVPIFSGGGVSAAARKASADYEVALHQQDEVSRTVMASTRQTYLNVMSDISKIKADRQAVISNQSSVNAMRQGYKVGTRTIVDVLNAEKALYGAKKTWAADRYDYINQIILLKEAAGTLNENDLNDINTWLAFPAPKMKTFKAVKAKTTSGRYIQIGAYYNQKVAQDVLKRVQKITKTHAAIYSAKTGKRTIYRLQVGPVKNTAQLKKQLKAHGFTHTLIVTK